MRSTGSAINWRRYRRQLDGDHLLQRPRPCRGRRALPDSCDLNLRRLQQLSVPPTFDAVAQRTRDACLSSSIAATRPAWRSRALLRRRHLPETLPPALFCRGQIAWRRPRQRRRARCAQFVQFDELVAVRRWPHEHLHFPPDRGADRARSERRRTEVLARPGHIPAARAAER
jgi:hypothetical protein